MRLVEFFELVEQKDFMSGWYHPATDEYVGAPFEEHIDALEANPEKFGITKEHMDEYEESHAFDPGMLYQIAMENGWVRFTTLYRMSRTLDLPTFYVESNDPDAVRKTIAWAFKRYDIDSIVADVGIKGFELEGKPQIRRYIMTGKTPAKYAEAVEYDKSTFELSGWYRPSTDTFVDLRRKQGGMDTHYQAVEQNPEIFGVDPEEDWPDPDMLLYEGWVAFNLSQTNRLWMTVGNLADARGTIKLIANRFGRLPEGVEIDHAKTPEDYDEYELEGGQVRKFLLTGKLPAKFEEAKLLELAPPQSEEFWKWFADSKVVDNQGNPEAVYHGTISPRSRFVRYKPFTHFGTSEAASRIVADKLDNLRGGGDRPMGWLSPEERRALRQALPRVYPVYLSIQNPIELEDTGTQHDISDYAKAFVYTLFFPELKSIEQPITHYIQSEYEEILSKNPEVKRYGLAQGLMTDDPKDRELIKKILRANEVVDMLKSGQKLKQHMLRHGYDGFWYINNEEDPGSYSWVILDDKQVWPVFKEEQNEAA